MSIYLWVQDDSEKQTAYISVYCMLEVLKYQKLHALTKSIVASLRLTSNPTFSADMPYRNMAQSSIVSQIISGDRLPTPEYASEEM